MLPHWDRSCRSNFLPHAVTVYLHQAASPSADPITPGTWQGSHWSANFWVTGMTRPRKNPGASGIRTWDLRASALKAVALTTRPTRQSGVGLRTVMSMNMGIMILLQVAVQLEYHEFVQSFTGQMNHWMLAIVWTRRKLLSVNSYIMSVSFYGMHACINYNLHLQSSGIHIQGVQSYTRL